MLKMHLAPAVSNSASCGEESEPNGKDADGSEQGLIREAKFRWQMCRCLCSKWGKQKICIYVTDIEADCVREETTWNLLSLSWSWRTIRQLLALIQACLAGQATLRKLPSAVRRGSSVYVPWCVECDVTGQLWWPRQNSCVIPGYHRPIGRIARLWVNTQWEVIIPYRRCGITYGQSLLMFNSKARGYYTCQYHINGYRNDIMQRMWTVFPDTNVF
jgi:hypothetical protein